MPLKVPHGLAHLLLQSHQGLEVIAMKEQALGLLPEPLDRIELRTVRRQEL